MRWCRPRNTRSHAEHFSAIGSAEMARLSNGEIESVMHEHIPHVLFQLFYIFTIDKWYFGHACRQARPWALKKFHSLFEENYIN